MRKGSIVLSLALAGVSLIACNKQTGQTPGAPATGAPVASLPLAQGAAPPLIAAPALAALPSAPPVKYASAPPSERYRYIDRARALGSAFADSPPDYTVDYAGVRPWIWRSGRGEYRVVEPTPEGERTYYYDAGSDEPFLISDPEYSYGFSQGALSVIYTRDGRVVEYARSSAERAARELARARALYAAAVHRQRQAAYATAWRERREQVLSEQRAWDAAQQRDAEWRQWHDQHQRAEQADWDREHAMRAAYAATVAATIVSAVASGHEHDRDRQQQDGATPPGHPPFGQPGQPWGRSPNPSFAGRRDDHGPAQQQAQAQQQGQAAQAEVSRQQAEAARAAQAAGQAEAARKTQLQAAQVAAARQQADAARAAQADAARKTHVESAQRAATQKQQDAARSAEATAHADAAHKAQLEAAQRAAGRRQADAAHAAQAAQVQKSQAQAAQAAAQRQAEAAKHTQALAKAQAQAQNPEAMKRGEQIKADMAKLAARKGDKPEDKKDHPHPH